MAQLQKVQGFKEASRWLVISYGTDLNRPLRALECIDEAEAKACAKREMQLSQVRLVDVVQRHYQGLGQYWPEKAKRHEITDPLAIHGRTAGITFEGGGAGV